MQAESYIVFLVYGTNISSKLIKELSEDVQQLITMQQILVACIPRSHQCSYLLANQILRAEIQAIFVNGTCCNAEQDCQSNFIGCRPIATALQIGINLAIFFPATKFRSETHLKLTLIKLSRNFLFASNTHYNFFVCMVIFLLKLKRVMKLKTVKFLQAFYITTKHVGSTSVAFYR